jgi:hypothetical protein
MATPLWALLTVVPLLLLVPLVAGLLAWVVLRPADAEPVARARLRRASGTGVAAATALVVVMLLPAAALAMASTEAAAVTVVVAGLLHVAVLWTAEAVTARPHAARRTALLVDEPRPPWRTALRAALVAAALGLLVVLGVSLLPGDAAPVLRLGPRVTLLVVAPAVLLAAVVLLAARQVARRAGDARLHPQVDDAGRARAEHRLLRAGAAGTVAALGLLLVGHQVREAAAHGDPVATTALVLGGLLLLVAAVVAVVPPPALPLRPDQGAPVEARAGTGDA